MVLQKPRSGSAWRVRHDHTGANGCHGMRLPASPGDDPASAGGSGRGAGLNGTAGQECVANGAIVAYAGGAVPLSRGPEAAAILCPTYARRPIPSMP